MASVVTTASIIFSSNKIQNGIQNGNGILVLACPDPPGKWQLKWREI